MRHNDARKLLHAGLDLLPVLLIPVFMIYSHRHTLTEQTTVDIQYKYQSNEVNSVDDLVEDNIYLCEDFSINFSHVIGYQDVIVFGILSFDDLSFDATNGYVDEIYFSEYNNANNNNLYFVIAPDDTFVVQFTNDNAYISYYYEENCRLNGTNVIIQIKQETIDFLQTYNDLSLQYTDYNIIENVDVQDTNSSVMNVFMDNFNGAIDKYFNMGNVFNLNGVYQWFNTNIFGGNAPTIIYSVWNIALYELVMDLLFLLYGLFMWFIDICKHLMDKPFRSIK